MTIQIQGAIFDLDGTLGDTVFVSVEAIVRTVDQLTGHRYSHEEVIDHFGPTEPGILRQLAPETPWEVSFPIFLKTYESIHRQFKVGRFPGIQEILEVLHQSGIRQAIVTGKSRESADISLRYFNLNGYFEHVETGSIEGSAKKICIQKVVDSWQIPAENVLYIGDAPSDVTIARSAGVRPISVSWADTASSSLLSRENPDALFERVGALKNWLSAQLNGSTPKRGSHVP